MTPALQTRIQDLLTQHTVVLFMKGTLQFPMCGFSGRAVQVLQLAGFKDIKDVNVLEDHDLREGIKEHSQWPTLPQVYIKGEFIGGSDILVEMLQAGDLQKLADQ